MTKSELFHWFERDADFCGCGIPEAAAHLVHDVLRCAPFYEEHNQIALERLLPTNGLFYFVLYQLERLDLLEHGGSVGGAWLTAKGADVLAALNALADDDFEDLFDISAHVEDDPECAMCRVP